MVYFIFGLQSASIKSRIKKIVKQSLDFVDEMNFVKFDGSQTNVQDWVDEATFMPLGYDKKVISVENCYFLMKTKGRNKIESEQNYDKLVDYLEHPNDSTVLIISVITDTLDEKSELVKLLRSKSNVIQIAEPDKNQWKDYVRMYCIDHLKMNIDRDALIELGDRTATDVALFQNNAKKLALYKDHITYDDVCLMVQRPLEDNVYQIFNHLLNGRNGDALSIYRDLRVSNTEPIYLIGVLANQFRTLQQVKYLASKKMSDEEIAKELGIKTIRVTIMKKSIYSISEKVIRKTLDQLFELDCNIKSGTIDRLYAFEMFLINFIKE